VSERGLDTRWEISHMHSLSHVGTSSTGVLHARHAVRQATPPLAFLLAIPANGEGLSSLSHLLFHDDGKVPTARC
jgi:hypothetical protein